MKLPKFDFKKIGQKIAFCCLNQARSILLALVVLVFLIAGMIFYFYVLKVPSGAGEASQVLIKKDIYQQVSERFKNREALIQQGMETEWRDVFR